MVSLPIGHNDGNPDKQLVAEITFLKKSFDLYKLARLVFPYILKMSSISCSIAGDYACQSTTLILTLIFLSTSLPTCSKPLIFFHCSLPVYDAKINTNTDNNAATYSIFHYIHSHKCHTTHFKHGHMVHSDLLLSGYIWILQTEVLFDISNAYLGVNASIFQRHVKTHSKMNAGRPEKQIYNMTTAGL